MTTLSDPAARAADSSGLRVTRREQHASSPPCGNASRPWDVARWGRLMAGVSVLLCTGLALLHHPIWLAGSLLTAANLIFAAVTDRCALRDLLLRMGAKEREDLFLPGGAMRSKVAS